MPVVMFNDVLSALFQRAPWRAGLSGWNKALPVEKLCRDLLGSRGEVSGTALAAAILDAYRRMEGSERLAFFTMLARDFEVDTQRCLEAAQACAAEATPANLAALRAASEPPRQELFRRLNLAEGGTDALVRLRADLLGILPDHPELGPLDADLRHLFASWFNRGFLVFRSIDWSSPAALLEKIIAYEAVHEIHDWTELRRRVQPGDRLCFAFFHPAMPSEPLIVIEVALTMEVPASIGSVLSETRQAVDPAQASVACFYSISNCQEGLRGISFGSLLIKQVAQHLAAAFPKLKTFVTLSPVPGFANWLREKDVPMPGEGDREPFLADDARRDKFLALAARYLAEARRGENQPRDPVARFHLGNGAVLHALHWAADPSPKGMAQSAGIMVNYLYDLDAVEKNHEAFVATGRVATSRAVAAWLGKAKAMAGAA